MKKKNFWNKLKKMKNLIQENKEMPAEISLPAKILSFLNQCVCIIGLNNLNCVDRILDQCSRWLG